MKFVIAKHHALIGVAALTAGLIADMAGAEQPAAAEHKTVTVRYSDLDLSRSTDAHRLYRRIKSAARTACDYTPVADLERLTRYERCVDQAITDAVAHVRSPQLTNIHEAAVRRSSRG
jgi:UrcA family protein